MAVAPICQSFLYQLRCLIDFVASSLNLQMANVLNVRILRKMFCFSISCVAIWLSPTLLIMFFLFRVFFCIRLVTDRETGKPKGYGFCEYKDEETALSARRNLQGYEINGRQLRVDFAENDKNADRNQVNGL